MKNFQVNRTRIWGIALLTAFVGAPLLTAPTFAAPDPNPRASGRDDRRNDDRRNDDRRNDDRNDRRNDERNDRRDNANYTGIVTNVRSGNSFDLSANGRTYNVYTLGNLPRGLSRGDRVSVSGDGNDGNDIRRASVSILDPNRNDPNRDNYRPEDNYEAYRTYRGTVEILLPGTEFNARINGRIYKIYSTASTRDLRVGDSVEIYGQLDRGVNIRNARITQSGNRNNDRYDNNRPDYGNGYDNGNGYGDNRDLDTYTGEVTAVQSDREFTVRIDGRSYDVYADSSSRRVERGDIVRIVGRRSGDNDIRDARVSLTRNNYDDRYNDDSSETYRTYSGVVTNVRSDREFDVNIDGRTYNVTTDSSTRGLNRGDSVRIYGRRVGDNDIRNANARVARNR